MTASLSQCIAYIYPDIDLERGCLVQDDGAGPYIAAWNEPRPQPLSDEIAAAAKPAALAIVGERIKSERDRRKGLGCPVGPHRFHSDDASRIQQIGLVMFGQSMPPGIKWKTMDGTFADMTPQLAQQIFAAQAQRDMGLFAVAEQHIAAAALADDPMSYDYSAGWPD